MDERYRKKRKRGIAFFLALCMMLVPLLSGCGGSALQQEEPVVNVAVGSEVSADTEEGSVPEIAGLTYESSLRLDYAQQYEVYYYSDGYVLIDIADEGQFLMVPDGMEVPSDLSGDITVIRRPQRIYLAATALMALFVSMDALDSVDTTSLNADGWTFDEPVRAIQEDEIVYAGKYSEPDYELLLDRECDLAIESTMIYHTPEVQEMLQDLGIPVLVDRSSYESNPLGRAEWIKLYAALTGHEAEAEAFFEDQKQKLAEIEDMGSNGKTVAFFYISTDGKAVVRSSTDYVPRMIEMAGGQYIFDSVTDEEGASSVPMTIEAFYNMAADADVIIYNQSIDASVQSIDDLIKKDPVMADLKAVQEGNVWATGSSMYQRTDIAADIILEFHKAIEGDASGLQYVSKLP